jgi:hypothetical protein
MKSREGDGKWVQYYRKGHRSPVNALLVKEWYVGDDKYYVQVSSADIVYVNHSTVIEEHKVPKCGSGIAVNIDDASISCYSGL